MALHKSADPNIFILPDLGEGVHEAELISWKVKPGDTVEEHQIVAEMETDKALVEVPSPRAGTIKELFGKVGDILKVGEPAWTYVGAGGASTTEAKPSNGHAKPGAPARQQASRLDPQFEESSTEPVERADAQTAREDDGTVVGTMSGELGAFARDGGKALATPAVRRLARDLGVEIDAVPGSGIGGRVTEKDVRGFAQRSEPRAEASGRSASAPSRQPAVSGEVVAAPQRVARENQLATKVTGADAPTVNIPVTQGSSRVPMRGVRRTIALRLRQSMDTAVHFTVMDEADCTALDGERAKLSAASGEKLSYLPFVVSAVCRALKQFPSLNATVDDANEEIVRHSVVHIGIAADTEQGLSVPVVPNADAMGVLQIGREIGQVAQMVRDRTIPRDRLMGSTFTISNVGSYAGRFATPVINYPEVGILAVGRVREGVVADKGAIRIAKLLPLSLTCDHRCVDGADAARCLALIIELLGKPGELVTPAR